MIIAFWFYPFYKKLNIVFNNRKNVAASVCTLLIFLLMAPIVLILFVNLGKEAVDLYTNILNFIKEGELDSWIEKIRALPISQKLETHLFELEIVRKNMQTWTLEATLAIGDFAAKEMAILARNILIVIVNFFLTFFLLFFFFRDGQRIYRFIYTLTPLEKKNKEDVFKQINETLSAVIRGQLVTAVAQAAAAGIVFWGLGLPLPIFFALLTFVTSLIPVVGASAVWVPFMIYLFSIGQETKGAILLVLGLAGISAIENILKPALIGERTKLPYFLLFLGILGGVKVFGIVGIFLAPTLLSLFF